MTVGAPIATPKQGDAVRFLVPIPECHIAPGMTGTVKHVHIKDDIEYSIDVPGLLGALRIDEHEAWMFEVVR